MLKPVGVTHLLWFPKYVQPDEINNMIHSAADALPNDGVSFLYEGG